MAPVLPTCARIYLSAQREGEFIRVSGGDPDHEITEIVYRTGKAASSRCA